MQMTMKKNRPTSRFTLARSHARIPIRHRRKFRPGVSLTELVVAMVIAIIVIFAIGTAIADGVRGWHKMYDRVYADVRTDSYVARITFDRVVRQATRHVLSVDSEGAWLEAYYYSTSSAPVTDRYARFYTSSGALLVEYGTYTPGASESRSQLRTDIVCQNVASCTFKADGRSAQMVLMLDDDSQNIVVVTSAVMNNG